ncbi:MAG TPA: hypothetical protein ENN34_04740 [Deltaproteobacteria bacterium]|nr:hypothetical protein [Deltaproteobacteria bacterium]
MIVVSYGKPCEVCHKRDAVVLCDGCQKALCRECRVFDIWCYGCGHGTTKAFCRTCFEDPEINIWKGRE